MIHKLAVTVFNLTLLKKLAFDPFDDQWSDYIVEFNAQLLNGDPIKIIRNDAPVGHNTSYGAWKELNPWNR